MLGSEQQLNDNNTSPISEDLETILNNYDLANQNFNDHGAMLSESDIAQILNEFETVLSENNIVQSLNDLGTMLNEHDSTNSKLEAISNKVGDKSSTSIVQNQSVQPSIEELQSSIIDKAEPGFSYVLQRPLPITYESRTKKLKTVSGVCIDDVKVDKANGDGSLKNKTQGELKYPVHIAVIKRDLEEVERLLNCGADVNTQDDYGNTPLHIAARHHNLEIVKMLLRFKPNLELRNSCDVTPLYYAATKPNIMVVELLLSYGADINAKDSKGNTILHEIIDLEDKKIALCLMMILAKKNVDLNIKNNRGECFISLVLDKLKRFYQTTDRRRFSLLLGLVEKHYDRLNTTSRSIIQGDSEFNAIVEEYRNGVSQTCNSIIDIIKLYSDRMTIDGISRLYNDEDLDNNTLLHNAVKKSLGLKVIKTLLSACIDINAQNSRGNTVLHTAIHYRNKVEIIRELLKFGADVNIQNDRGSAALHIAIYYRNEVEIIRELLKFGADVDIQNDHGSTALHIALCHHSKLEIVGELLKFSTDVNLQNASGDTLLHVAINFSGRYGTLKVLLNHEGVDPNKQNNLGDTPLHNALKNNIPEHSLWLLLKDNRVCLNIKNKEGKCFTSIILDRFKRQNEKNMVKLLAQYYDRLNDKSKLIIKSNSEFHHAVENYRRSLIPYNTLNRPSSSNYADEFLNITKSITTS